MIEWYLEAKGMYDETLGRITDWGIWLFFVLETVVLTSLVKDKFRYLRSNWMNLLIISIGVPLLWGGGTYAAALRMLRVLLIFPVVAEYLDYRAQDSDAESSGYDFDGGAGIYPDVGSSHCRYRSGYRGCLARYLVGLGDGSHGRVR